MDDQPTAYDILKFLEQNIAVQQGMLSATNILLHRVTIYDREDWRERLTAELEILKSKLGDKVGVLGDMRIVGLDGGGTEVATGKFAVHLGYRGSYQAHKLTILALVKA